MNVEAELRAVDRKVKAQIDANAREALIRIGVDVEAEELAEIESGAELLGQAWRSLIDGMTAFASAFNRGFNGGPR